MPRFKDIKAKSTYKDTQGNEKNKWDTVGKLIMTDKGAIIVSLFMFPGTTMMAFDQENKNGQGGSGAGASDDLPPF